MTQLTQNQSFLLIEDQLDAIGQKHRLVQILRGAMLWVAWGIIAAMAAALFADALGQGPVTMVVLGLLGVWLIGSSGYWIGRPLFRRASSVAVARLIEERVQGLHDGLTNSVLLAQSAELALNPWTSVIYDEVLANCQARPLDGAVRFSELKPLGMRLGGVIAVAVIFALLLGGRVAHGWQQIMAPATFVPKVGKVQIVDVQPGDVTLVMGQPLEIGVVARAPQSSAPDGKLVFDGAMPGAPLAAAAGTGEGELRYSYRMDHVDESLRYRVEIGGTQSAWYSVKVVPKVSLAAMDIRITPPAYTHLAARQIAWSASDSSLITVPLGSQIEIGANIDVAMKRGVLMVNDQSPVEMTAAMNNQRFFKQMTAMGDATVFVGILGGGQIIAKLPENGVNIHVVPDAAPTIAMRSPSQDETIAPTQSLTIAAEVRDDYGVSAARLLVGFGSDEPQVLEGSEQKFDDAKPLRVVQFALNLTADQAKHDSVVSVQVEATDNRDLASISKDMGPQRARSQRVVIHMQDPKQIAMEQMQQADQLAAQLKKMIELQQALEEKTKSLFAVALDRDAMGAVGKGQSDLRDMMKQAGQPNGAELDERVRVVKKSLILLSVNTATDAVNLASQIVAEPLPKEQSRQGTTLLVKQEAILSTLQTLLAGLSAAGDPATRPTAVTSPPMPSRPDAFKKLDEALTAFEKEQQRILDQTAPLAKKAVDNFDENDKKNLDDLRMAQDKLDAFMQQALSDFSKNAQQDMSNPVLAKELTDIYTQVTMAKDALNAKMAETAVPLEEMGLESAKSLQSNLEKWLDNKPDRQAYTQEDPVDKNDAPQADLPKDLQDMIGDLLEQQEDLDQQMQQANANWQDSMDKGAGWNAKDGPIADNTAKGISANVLPQNNDMQGKSGSGRNGMSSGEIVADTATDKGGRNTPTRLDPTPFQPGQIKDTSETPAGGATGGGKMSGLGASGLEGPVPPKVAGDMKRLAKMQAQIRNSAEKLNLQYKLGRYDNFKLLQSIMDMRRVESDLQANRYNNAMHNTDTVVNELTTSSILLGGRIQVQVDTTPTSSRREKKEIDDAAQGDLPPVWSDALREYYQKLSQQ